MRVLLVTAAGERGGAEVTMERIARHFDRSRYQAVMAVPAGSALASSWRASGLVVRDLPAVRRLRNVGETRALVRAIAAVAGHDEIGLVHAHGVAAQWQAGLAARRAGRPLIAHAQDIVDRSWTLNGLAHRLALLVPRDLTIASSTAVAASLGRLGLPHRCEVIPNPVDSEVAAPIDRPGPLVVWCGRLQRWKGCHLFLEAARLVRDVRADARFAVVGGSLFGLERDYAEELRRQAKRLDLAGAVEFAGHVDDARPWMRAADLFVHSSERPEPFGLVMAEAMIQERPVVAFGHGGAAEIVVDGETGRLIPPGDVARLARAIIDLLSDARTRDAMGRAGRARAVARYASETVARRVEAVYDRVLGGSSPS